MIQRARSARSTKHSRDETSAFELRCLEFPWSLEFGIWSFISSIPHPFTALDMAPAFHYKAGMNAPLHRVELVVFFAATLAAGQAPPTRLPQQ